MPAEQNGYTSKYRGSWCARWYDENGKRRRKRGFETRTEARQFLRRKVDEVARLRRGEAVLGGRTAPPTVRELIAEFLDQYAAEANSKATLEHRLRWITGGRRGEGITRAQLEEIRRLAAGRRGERVPFREIGRRFGLSHSTVVKLIRDGLSPRPIVPPATFADLRVDRLTVPTVAAWRKRLPAGSAWHIHKALRQVLNYAVAAGYVQRNVARDVPNPEPKRGEVPHFETTEQIDWLAAEMADVVSAAAVIFASETGLRTEEWLALERADIDQERMVVHVRRVFVDGRVREYGKTTKSLRVVPLTDRSLAAVRALPRRLDTPILFPRESAGRRKCNRCRDGCLHLNLAEWRADVWTPALRGCGLDVDEQGRQLKRTPYSLRHTYATWMLATSTPTADVAEFMGTSIDQLEKTYRHRTSDAHDRARSALAVWQARKASGLHQ